jgi:protein SCO1/2
MMLIPLLVLTLSAADASSRLAVIQPAPDFTLTTQDGKSLPFAGFKGKVLLVSFIFTTCNGTCPATTHRMAQVQEALHQKGLDRAGKVQLLSITLDPERDTPDALRRYMKLYDVDPANWTFLTGPPQKVAKVISAWGMWVKPAANDQFDHPSRIFLVDRGGFIREIYHLGFLKPAWVVEDIELLLTDQRSP